PGIPRVFEPDKKTQLKRHVKARQLIVRAEFGPRNVMDTELGFLDKAQDFGGTGFSGIVHFQGAAGHETAILNGKDESPKQGQVLLIKRAIDKNASRETPGEAPGALLCHRSPSARPCLFLLHLPDRFS